MATPARPGRSRRTPVTKSRGQRRTPRRPSLLRFLDGVGRPELLIFAATIAVGVWAWFAYVLVPPAEQEFPAFTVILCVASGLGALLQVIYLVFVRSPGTVRDRLTLRSVHVKGGTVVFWAPPILFGLIFLAITPPSTSAAGFDPDMNIYQVIFITVLICLIFTAVGALAVFSAIVIPLTWILLGVLPKRSRAHDEPGTISRIEYLCGGLIVLCAVGFGISMSAVGPGAGEHDTRSRMTAQLLALVTFRGNVAASILVVLFVACIVVLVVLSNHATRRRETRHRRRHRA